MIVKMKKVHLVVDAKRKEYALKILQGANVLHVIGSNHASNRVNEISAKLSLLNQAISLLPKVKTKQTNSSNKKINDLIEQVINLGNQIKSSEADIISYKKEIDRISLWGNFDPKDIRHIEKQGYFIRLYEISKKEYSEINTDLPILKISVLKNKILFATISKTDEILKASSILKFDLPTHSLLEFSNLIQEKTDFITKNKKELVNLANFAYMFDIYKLDLQSQLEFENTLASMDNREELSVLSGYIPVSKLAEFKSLVAKEKWGALYSNPTNEEINDVPTLTEQKFVGKIIDPILKMFDLIPGYKEFDISFVMFFFFTIFFSMIIGDAAYGLIFLIIAVTIAIKQKLSGKSISPLVWSFMWLSFATFIWGTLNGVWLGLEYIEKQPFLTSLVISDLKDPMFLQKLTFIIGVSHLSIARLWSISRLIKTNICQAIASLGSLTMLISLYYVVLFLLLGASTITQKELPGGHLPSWILPATIIGFVLVLVFHHQKPGRSFGKGLVLGLANIFPTFLESVENFSNIISYIRLYAVSLAGLAIAEAFNDMALGMPWYLGVLVMLGAHSLNMVLALLGVVVHGLRLNSLEFSNHLGIAWSGTAYEPFGYKKSLNK